jgi:hypothetical protein
MTLTQPTSSPFPKLLEKKHSDVGLLIKIGVDNTHCNWFKIVERAVPFATKINDGAYVKATFATDTTIGYIQEVDATGKEIERPKRQWSGGRKTDPRAEQIKQLSIQHECMLKEARQFVSFAHDRNMNKEARAELWKEILDLAVIGSDTITVNIEKEVSKYV